VANVDKFLRVLIRVYAGSDDKFFFFFCPLGPDPVFGAATGSARPAPPRARIRVLVSAARIRNLFPFISFLLFQVLALYR
jgi:hypothetical protein